MLRRIGSPDAMYATSFGGIGSNADDIDPCPRTPGRSLGPHHASVGRCHSVPELVEIVPQVGVELPNRLPIHASRARIGLDRFVSFVHLLLCNLERLVCRMHRRPPVSSCFDPYDRLTRSLRSGPITELSTLLRIGPPQCSASVLSPRGFRRLSFSLAIRATGSCSSAQKPASDSRPLHAGRRLPSHQAPDRLVPEGLHAPGFDDAMLLYDASSKGSLSFVSRMFTCPRSSLSFSSNAHHHGSLPQQLGVV